VHCHELDLSVPRDVARFANNFDKPLHILVNNAGCMVHDRQLDSDGLEKNFATNTLGTYVLTVGLIPALRRARSATGRDEKPRVIVVSSGGMLTELLESDDLNSCKLAYCGFNHRL
jgi:dehydrogenase/reductase SDR family protein 12